MRLIIRKLFPGQGHGRQFRYFINLTSLAQGDEENRTRQTLLFTIYYILNALAEIYAIFEMLSLRS